MAEGERALVPLPAGGTGLTPADMAGRATRLALSAAGLALALEALLERSRPVGPGVRAGAVSAAMPSGSPGTLRLLPVAMNHPHRVKPDHPSRRQHRITRERGGGG